MSVLVTSEDRVRAVVIEEGVTLQASTTIVKLAVNPVVTRVEHAERGPQGVQGIPGPPGEDGATMGDSSPFFIQADAPDWDGSYAWFETDGNTLWIEDGTP